MKNPKTNDLLKLLTQARNEQELDGILKSQPDALLSFNAYFAFLMQQKQVSTVDVLKKVDIERTYIYQVLNGKRNPKRNKILSMASAIHCTLEETQRLLTLAGKGLLYSKNPRDAVIIYAISRGYDPVQINTMLYEKEMELLK